ncbi:MAG: prolipoprotein diacylglyceryl transferase [Gemmatimonadales bacterium]
MQHVIHHPFAYQAGPFLITGFGIAMLLTFVIAQIVMTTELRRRGHGAAADSMSDLTVAAVIGGLAGAKLYYVLLTGDSFFHRGGFVFWGGLLGGIASVWAVIKLKKFPVPVIADVAAIGLAAAYAVGRTGCWAVGDDYGRPWTSRFAVSFPNGAPPSTVHNMIADFGMTSLAGRPPQEVLSVYPTQLFEVALGLVMFAVLWRLRHHLHREGWLFGVYCMLAGGERFIVEFFRAKDDRFLGPLTIAQAIALAMIVAGAVIAMRFRGRAAEPAPQPDSAPASPS